VLIVWKVSSDRAAALREGREAEETARQSWRWSREQERVKELEASRDRGRTIAKRGMELER